MEVVILIGLQATGKSTFYKEKFFTTHMRINLDMLKTRNSEDILIDACIRAKQSFVVDNTNPSAMVRKKYIDIAKAAGAKVIGYYFQSSIDEVIPRNEKRTGKEHVPLAAIKGTYAKLQLPDKEEGFDELYYVRINIEGQFEIEEWKYEVL